MAIFTLLVLAWHGRGCQRAFTIDKRSIQVASAQVGQSTTFHRVPDRVWAVSAGPTYTMNDREGSSSPDTDLAAGGQARLSIWFRLEFLTLAINHRCLSILQAGVNWVIFT